ncbi:MAG: hypothetical protein LBU50_03965 [Cellulomonas sp.]|nr:hypothetical protein [Cellulomonas sp.]
MTAADPARLPDLDVCGCVCHQLIGYDCTCPADDPRECATYDEETLS